ncbi:hypothetical protein ABXV22_07070 [Vibrio rotiferianus]|uniref:hypothetical protein n=1 Tax=Vibrio rotiferianus TaxID=190895 RepID=UPI00339894D3
MQDLREYDEMLTIDEAEAIVIGYILEQKQNHAGNYHHKFYYKNGTLKKSKALGCPIKALKSFYENIDELQDMGIIRAS